MKRITFVLLAAAVLLSAASCAMLDKLTQKEEPEQTIAKTALPVITLEPTPEPTPKRTPVKTIEPDPTPTPTPFSYYAPTTLMTFEELVGDDGVRDKIPEPPPSDTYYVVINIKYQLVLVYEKDRNGEYTKPVRYMSCSSGAERSPTKLGSYELEGRHVRFGHFVNFDLYGQYWTRIFGRTYFHSITYTKRNAQYYTEDAYEDMGSQASHACIRLYVPDARWIFYYLAPGTTVDIIEGEEDEDMQAIKDQMIFPSLPEERPVLKPGEVPLSEPIRTAEPKE